jgi:hypothetical protein
LIYKYFVGFLTCLSDKKKLDIIWFDCSTCDIWFGFSACDIWFGFSTCDIWFGFSTCDIWFGSLTCDIWLGFLTCVSSEDLSHVLIAAVDHGGVQVARHLVHLLPIIQNCHEYINLKTILFERV